MTVPIEDRPRYRDRKGNLSTNVLATCDPNLRFTYVLLGWEGSASDLRVLRDAFRRPNGLKVPKNRYLLVDLGYSNAEGFLAPYKGTRYHLNLWRGNTPTNEKELFNLRHSSARNTIEMAFGLLKKRWSILRNSSFFPKNIQINEGNKGDGEFKSQAYQTVVDNVRKQLGILVTMDQVKNRIKVWKKHHSVINDIKTYTKFKWNDKKKVIVIPVQDLQARHVAVLLHIINRNVTAALLLLFC
uniref:DDE Tnp4 domain-containing protein n=1 Tax=Chenopodium quinoa TaxID=63459 RepID=A0A803N625_CHEQI